MVWSTDAMVHWASPLVSVVPLQVCEVVPDPMVNVTTLVGRGVSGVGGPVVSVPVRVVGSPLTAVAGPVYVTELVSGLTVKVEELLTDPIGVDCVESPGNEALRV